MSKNRLEIQFKSTERNSACSILNIFPSASAVIKPILNALFNSFMVRDSRRGWKDMNLWIFQVERYKWQTYYHRFVFLKPFSPKEVGGTNDGIIRERYQLVISYSKRRKGVTCGLIYTGKCRNTFPPCTVHTT